jgi:hypothetical protein
MSILFLSITGGYPILKGLFVKGKKWVKDRNEDALAGYLCGAGFESG